MVRGLQRGGRLPATVFAVGVLGAALLVRLPAALAAVGGDPPGPNHPVKHDCLLKGCDDIVLTSASCPGGCTGLYNGTFWKCYPVDYDSSCDESSSNGGVTACDFFCLPPGGPARYCGQSTFYPCAGLGHIPPGQQGAGAGTAR